MKERTKILTEKMKYGGGLYVGPSHEQGGIQVEVVHKSVGNASRKVEVEGLEYKICEEAYNSPQRLVLPDVTNKEALDYIHGQFSCKFEQHKAAAGDFIICKRVVTAPVRKTRSGTVKEILNQMQSEGGCKVEHSPHSLHSPQEMMREGGSTFTVTDKQYAHESFKSLVSKVATKLMTQLKVNPYLMSRDNFRMMLYDDKNIFDELRRIYDRERNWRDIEINRLRILREKVSEARGNPQQEEKVIAEIMAQNPDDYLALLADDEQTLLRYVDSKTSQHVNYHSTSSGKQVIPHYFIRFTKEEWQSIKQQAEAAYRSHWDFTKKPDEKDLFFNRQAERVRNLPLAAGGPLDNWVMPENVTHEERQFEWELPINTRRQPDKVLWSFIHAIANQIMQDLNLHDPVAPLDFVMEKKVPSSLAIREMLMQDVQLKRYLEQVTDREINWLKHEQQRLTHLQQDLKRHPEQTASKVMTDNPDEYLVMMGGKQAIQEYVQQQALQQNHLSLRTGNKVIRMSRAEYDRIKDKIVEKLKKKYPDSTIDPTGKASHQQAERIWAMRKNREAKKQGKEAMYFAM